MDAYKKRHVQEVLLQLAQDAKVIMITGARQVGKSTLLREMFPDITAVTFDPIQDIGNARRDPDAFLDNFLENLH